jgi:NAD(P)-dependent dehydrogenase (short-subunit alcohol dehydrogenase family)
METKAFTITPSQLQGPKDGTTLITGGSAGIGLQTALLLHSLGNNIAAVDIKPPAAAQPTWDLQSLIVSPRFQYIHADITSWTSQRAAFETAVRKFGRIDGVFVNAGLMEYQDQFFTDRLDTQGRLAEPDRRTLDVDVRAAGDTVKLAIYHMRQRHSQSHSDSHGQDRGKVGGGGGQQGGQGGSIVMTASLAGYLASAGAPLYSAAKHGLVGLSRALKHDVAKVGIAISVVAPAITLTSMALGETDAAGIKQGAGGGAGRGGPGELQQSLEEYSALARKSGIPLNDPRDVAAAVVWLMGLGMAANGRGLLVQNGRVADVEAGYAKTRKLWMSEEMLDLFRGGRGAVAFKNKL